MWSVGGLSGFFVTFIPCQKPYTITPISKIENDADADAPIKITRQESKGIAYFDKDAGQLVETIVTSSMDMEIGAGKDAIVQKIQQTVTMTLKEQK